MLQEPDIVKILREEERLKSSQAPLSCSNDTFVKTEEKVVQESDDSLLLYSSHPGQFTNIDSTHLETIYQTALRIFPVAILVLDPQKRIISWNHYTESFLKRTNEELRYLPVTSLHVPEESTKITHHLDSHTRLEQQMETKILLKNNDTVAVAVTSCVLKQDDGNNLGYLYIIKNISENNLPGNDLGTLIHYADDAIYLLDINSQYLMVNTQLLQRLGRPREEVMGKTFHDFHTYEETKEFTRKLAWVFTQGIPLKDLHSKEGRWYLRTLNPVKESSTSPPTAVLVISRDITEMKKTEEMLIQNEQKYRTFFDCSPQPSLVVDPTGIVVDVNERMNEWVGYTPSEVLEKNLYNLSFLTKESKKSLKKIFSKRYLNKKIPIFEIEALTKHGEKRVGLVSTSPLRDEQGDIRTYLFTISEQIKQKNPSDALRIQDNSFTSSVNASSEREKRFQVVLENSLDMIYQLDLQKQICDYVSPSSAKIIGYTSDEMIALPLKNIEELIHPEDSIRWSQHIKTITDHQEKQQTIQSLEYRLKHKSRGYRWIHDTYTAIYDGKNESVSIIGTLEDITDRKKVWEELVKSEEKYRILAETSADGVFTTDALGRLTYVNPSFEKLCGRRKSQILATPFRNYLLEDSVYFFQQIFLDVRKKNDKIENVELELVAGNGSITPIEANIAPLTKQEEFSGVVCTVRDITQRREIEDELKKNERLKTEFMNIAAHELRSPVTPIKGYLDLIIHDNESNEKIKNWAKISLRNAERLLKLVNDILDVSRLDSDTMRFDMEKIDLVEFLNELVEDMRPAIVNKKLEFRVNIPSPLPHIIGDKNRLNQVLKNLIGNSLKFTDCGYIGLEVEKKDNHILITVIDSGIGISKDELKKIFTKFYQAYTGEDRNNEGTGLGLFISKEIVKKHNGEIWAESEIGNGSRFIIQLPYVYKMIVDFKT